jgi:hypothetical protein
MGMSHRDDAAATVPGRPDQANAAIMQVAPNSIALLAVIPPVVLDLDVLAFENEMRIGDIKAPFF